VSGNPPLDAHAAMAQDHSDLLASAQTLLTDLREFRGRFQETRQSYAIHYDFADRALSLEGYLSAALTLAMDGSYMPAFALLRSALEHQLVDQLLLLGRRYKQVVTEMKRTDFNAWHQAWKSRKPGTETITSLRWTSKATALIGSVEVVHTGIHQRGGRTGRFARALSIYYILLRDYNPFIGAPWDQRFLVREHGPLEVYMKLAEDQRRTYGNLKWDGIRDGIKYNLRLNGLLTEKTLRQLGVHYRFLSASVHPWPAATDLVYGRRASQRGRYDHYASELVLLYIIEIAAAELISLGKMASRAPRLKLADWPSLLADVKAAKASAAHFWFPGGEPHEFDRVAEANARLWHGRKGIPRSFPPKHVIRPDQLTHEQIRYYRNPLRRLIQMHVQTRELMGFTYISPWPRADAQQRLIQT
jgi:hypothetical protein